MKSIGFPISHKENENRRTIVPEDFYKLSHPEQLFFETGYWNVFGISDDIMTGKGAVFLPRFEVLKKDIICDPKVGDADYLTDLHNQTVFGWVHAVQNHNITDILLNGKLTAYTWEDMANDGRHVFWRNNEIAGEAAIMSAFQCYGDMPYNAKVALIGMGHVAQGAYKILTLLGAKVTVYTRRTEALLSQELSQYDVIVNAVMWDVARKDHLINVQDLKRMKPNSLIIDISCDKNGGIETSIPTDINDPIYIVDGIVHYVVDHTPSLFYKTASKGISSAVYKYINLLAEETVNPTLENAKIIDHGKIIDKRIIDFQKRGLAK